MFINDWCHFDISANNVKENNILISCMKSKTWSPPPHPGPPPGSPAQSNHNQFSPWRQGTFGPKCGLLSPNLSQDGSCTWGLWEQRWREYTGGWSCPARPGPHWSPEIIGISWTLYNWDSSWSREESVYCYMASLYFFVFAFFVFGVELCECFTKLVVVCHRSIISVYSQCWPETARRQEEILLLLPFLGSLLALAVDMFHKVLQQFSTITLYLLVGCESVHIDGARNKF